MLPVLLVLRLRLQRRLLHRPMALRISLRPFQSLLQRLLLDPLRATLHRLQTRRLDPRSLELHQRSKILRILLRAMHRCVRGRVLQLCEGDPAGVWRRSEVLYRPH